MDSAYLHTKANLLEALDVDSAGDAVDGHIQANLTQLDRIDRPSETRPSCIAPHGDVSDEDGDEEKLYLSSSEGLSSSLEMYMESLSRFPPLKEEEELLLAKQIRDREEECRAIIVQWARCFRKACRNKSISRKLKDNGRSFLRLSNTYDLFDGVARLDRQQGKISGTLKQLSGSSKASQKLQDELYAVKAEIGKQIAGITLGKKWNRIMRRELKKLFCGAGEAKKQTLIHRELRKYLKEIDQSAQKIKALKTRMVQAHLRMVFFMAKKYAYHGLPLQDLIQEGNMGLMRAIDTYDYQRSPRFVTYAAWWIRQAFIRALNCKASTIRKPVYLNEKLRQINKESRRLQEECERNVTVEEIASGTNTPREVIERVLQSFKDPLSLDASDGEKGEIVIGAAQCERVTPILEQVISCNLSQKLDDVLSDLPLREREIVKLRFGIGTTHDHTLEEIGQKFSLSRERIRQILDAVLIKLRHSKRTIKLKDFIDLN